MTTSESDITRDLVAQGWSVYEDPGFIAHAGPFFYRMDGEGPRFCFPTSAKHENRNGVLQGGAFMTFMDRALGATARHLTQTPATATVTMTVQFIDAVGIHHLRCAILQVGRHDDETIITPRCR